MAKIGEDSGSGVVIVPGKIVNVVLRRPDPG